MIDTAPAPLVLVVEDDKSTRMVLRRIMEYDGWRVAEAENGVAGVAAFERLQPDLILMDAMMPLMDGFEACQSITAQPASQFVPILMVTALNDEASVDRAFEVGATDYLTKPLHLPVVRQRARRLWQARQANLARHQSEIALRASESRYRGMFDESPISLWEEDFSGVKHCLGKLQALGITDVRGYFQTHPAELAHCLARVNILTVNKATLRLYGAASPAELVGALDRIFPPSEQSAFIEELVHIAAGHTEFEWEGVNLTLSGQRLDIALRWSVVPGYEATLEKVLVSVLDITERKQNEAKIRQQAAELEAVFKAHPDMFFRLAPDGVVQQHYASTGTATVATGLPLTAFLPPELAASIQTLVHTTLQTRQMQTTELVWRAAAPEVDRIYEARLVPFLEAQVIAIVRDVTQLRQMQAQVLAGQKMADLGTLAAGVAHEINSPLQVITGVSHSLLARLNQNELSTDHLRRNLEVVHRNGWRCAEIVRALRTYARAAPAEFAPTDLNAIVRDTLLLIEHQLSSWSNIAVVTDLAADLPLLTCDHNQMTQVLINLFTNARDAMPSGGEIVVRTRHLTAAHRLALQITDMGVGIPEAARAKIFDPFFTTKPLGQGTGLGLSIVLGIVRAHGGAIEVSDGPDGGTTFDMYFPLHTPEAALREPAAAYGRFDDSQPALPAAKQ